MDFDKTYPKLNDDKAVSGVWQPMSADFEVLVAKAGNKRFIETSKKVFRPHRVAAQRGTLGDELVLDLACKIMSTTILLGWRGKATFSGKAVDAYTPERAESLLRSYPGFREDIVKMSDDPAAYVEEGMEVELGNSSSTSSGNSGGANSSQ